MRVEQWGGRGFASAYLCGLVPVQVQGNVVHRGAPGCMANERRERAVAAETYFIIDIGFVQLGIEPYSSDLKDRSAPTWGNMGNNGR